jgi:hypothetical protein
MTDIINPIVIDNNPFKTLPSDREAVAVKAKTISAKYSGGPNIKAIFASGKARKTKPIAASRPPIKEAIAEIARAASASPFIAIGYPSKQVATADASPGMLSKIELRDPPNIAPKKIAAIAIRAVSGFNTNVSGKSKAIPVAGPRPGTIPRIVPRTLPMVIQSIFDGLKTTSSPYIKCCNASIQITTYGKLIMKIFSNTYHIPNVYEIATIIFINHFLYPLSKNNKPIKNSIVDATNPIILNNMA